MKLARVALIGAACLAASPTMTSDYGIAVASSSAQLGSSEGRRCHPRVIRTTGDDGRGSQDLLVRGNINCVQAYGEDLEVEVELCDGEPATLRGITVHRESVTDDGRPRTFGANVYFQFVDDRGRRTPRRAILHSNRVRQISFPPQQVSRVVIGVAGLETRGYRIHQRICSIGFDMN